MNPDPKAFILAAGFGTRMRPLTDHCPKPLVEVAGRSLINRTLDHLELSEINDVMINTHYLGDILIDHLKTRTYPDITFSREEEILDTGGGIKKALGFFGDEPFYVLSGDGLWEDGPEGNALRRMADFWNPEEMDILILLQPAASMTLTKAVGDYDLEPDGRAVRSRDKTGTYMFTSMRINHPRVFENTPDEPFSYLEIMDRAQEQGRLYGLVHDGEWHHISTPEDLEAVNEAYVQNAETKT